jgi:hypothetical protein
MVGAKFGELLRGERKLVSGLQGTLDFCHNDGDLDKIF